MLFNSYEFIFLFLPITILLFSFLSKFKNINLNIGFIVSASFFFYGWWNPRYLVLLCISILFNYYFGKLIISSENNKKIFLVLGVSINLLSIAYFKYFHFFLEIFHKSTSINIEYAKIVLPLAISFFTFQQIMYLVDLYKEEITISPFLDYCLFVTFFPQLIAGPIVSYKEIAPQIREKLSHGPSYENLVLGVTIFFLGLIKKVFIADTMASFATPVFDSAAAGHLPNFFEAWGGTLAYTFQLYFDFSGYSDMAIGIGKMFDIQLPVNFNSPYKSKSIIEFWKRWHMTLSRFLLHYLYIPLGGNRVSRFRVQMNLMITMLLGGLWHGAGWTFVIWGGLHGLFLVINHFWRKGTQGLRWIGFFNGSFFPQFITFLAVCYGWIIFRADNIDAALLMIRGTVGLNNIHLPIQFKASLPFLEGLVQFNRHFLGSFNSYAGVFYISICFIITFKLPNVSELFPNFLFPTNIQSPEPKNKLIKILGWKPNSSWLVLTSIIILISILSLASKHEFIYFQF